MRHGEEVALALGRDVEWRQARHLRGLDDRVEHTVETKLPLLVRDARVDLEGLVSTPAQHALDQPARAVVGEQRAREEDAERVEAVVGELGLGYASAMGEAKREPAAPAFINL